MGDSYLNGCTSGLTLPSTAGGPLDITGDIDLRAEIYVATWPSGLVYIINGKFSLFLAPDGTIWVGINGQNSNTVSGVIKIPASTRLWVRVTRLVSSGLITFYISTDGVTWSNVGTHTSTPGAIASSSASLTLGSGFPGRIYRVQILSGVNGTAVASFDARAFVGGYSGSITDVNGNNYTLNGTASIAGDPATSSTVRGTVGSILGLRDIPSSRTSLSVIVRLSDAVGESITGIAYNSSRLAVAITRDGVDAAEQTQTLVAGSLTSWVSNGWIETSVPGEYRYGVPDAAANPLATTVVRARIDSRVACEDTLRYVLPAVDNTGRASDTPGTATLLTYVAAPVATAASLAVLTARVPGTAALLSNLPANFAALSISAGGNIAGSVGSVAGLQVVNGYVLSDQRAVGGVPSVVLDPTQFPPLPLNAAKTAVLAVAPDGTGLATAAGVTSIKASADTATAQSTTAAAAAATAATAAASINQRLPAHPASTEDVAAGGDDTATLAKILRLVQSR